MLDGGFSIIADEEEFRRGRLDWWRARLRTFVFFEVRVLALLGKLRWSAAGVLPGLGSEGRCSGWVGTLGVVLRAMFLVVQNIEHAGVPRSVFCRLNYNMV